MGFNHYITFWAASILLILAIICIGWSLILFFCVCDMLVLTGTDMVNAVVLLSGIVMLPTNYFILYSAVHGNQIDHRSKIMCCRIWTCIGWIILINSVGLILCVRRLCDCQENSYEFFSNSMKNYRSIPKHKHFIDNIQWILKCCGLHKYKDWFTQDWHDNIRDYEWDPSPGKYNAMKYKKETTEWDSVPQSCCKTGSCVSNFLKELGTYSIYTNGCGSALYHIVLTSMSIHFVLFLTVIILEVLILRYLSNIKNNYICERGRFVKQIMAVNRSFVTSSRSYEEDSDELFVINNHDDSK